MIIYFYMRWKLAKVSLVYGTEPEKKYKIGKETKSKNWICSEVKRSP